MSSLVVDTNLSAIAAQNALSQTDFNMTQTIQQLSTGLSVQTAADGPSAYVQGQALQSQVNGYQAAISNSQNGISLAQTASGALNQISNILQTMNQLALNSANAATQDSTSQGANQQEFVALQNQITQIATSTSYGTTQLLDGTFSAGMSLQIGAFSNDTSQITIAAVTLGALGIGTASVSIGSATAAASAIQLVQNAIASVDSIEAQVGATQNALQAIVANLTVGSQNLSAAHSQLVDVNMAQAMTNFSTDQILMQTGTSMLQQAQQAPSLILKLI